MNFLTDILNIMTMEAALIIVFAFSFVFICGFILGLTWGPDREIQQAKLVGYVITALWFFLHIAAVIYGTSVNWLVDVIMGIFTTGIYGDDFIKIFSKRI